MSESSSSVVGCIFREEVSSVGFTANDEKHSTAAERHDISLFTNTVTKFSFSPNRLETGTERLTCSYEPKLNSESRGTPLCIATFIGSTVQYESCCLLLIDFTGVIFSVPGATQFHHISGKPWVWPNYSDSDGMRDRGVLQLTPKIFSIYISSDSSTLLKVSNVNTQQKIRW